MEFKRNIIYNKINNINNINKMENNSVVRPSELDANKIEITPLRQNKKTKRFSAIIVQDNGRPLNIETPMLLAPFGISQYANGDSGSTAYSIPFIQRGQNNDDQPATVFFNKLRLIDGIIKQFGFDNSEKIFKKPLSKSVVDELYSSIVKTAVDDSGVPYPPKIQPKFIEENENPSLLFFKGSSEEPENLEEDGWNILMDTIKKGSYGRAIVQPRLWFISGKFGCTLKVLQLQVPEMVANRPTRFAFSNKSTDQGEKGSISNEDEDEEDDTKVDEEEEEGEEGEDGVEEEDSDDPGEESEQKS